MMPQQQPGDIEFFSPEAFQKNARVLDYTRTFMTIVAGAVSGVLGFTQFTGFGAYIAMMVITNAALLMKMNFKLGEYTTISMPVFITDGITAQIMSYILFWTLFYTLVHVY